MRADIRKYAAPPKLVYETRIYEYNDPSQREDHIQKLYQQGWRIKTEKTIRKETVHIKHLDELIPKEIEVTQVTFFRI